jgi:hypothetical protein
VIYTIHHTIPLRHLTSTTTPLKSSTIPQTPSTPQYSPSPHISHSHPYSKRSVSYCPYRTWHLWHCKVRSLRPVNILHRKPYQLQDPAFLPREEFDQGYRVRSRIWVQIRGSRRYSVAPDDDKPYPTLQSRKVQSFLFDFYPVSCTLCGVYCWSKITIKSNARIISPPYQRSCRNNGNRPLSVK